MFIRGGQHVGVLGNRPELLYHLHRFIEGFIIGCSLAKLLGGKDLGIAGIATKFAPLLLHIFTNKPLAKLEALIAFLRVAYDRKSLSTQRCKAPASRARRHGKVPGDFSVFVGGFIGESREEGEKIHAHRYLAIGKRLVRFEEERLTPIGRTESIEFL